MQIAKELSWSAAKAGLPSDQSQISRRTTSSDASQHGADGGTFGEAFSRLEVKVTKSSAEAREGSVSGTDTSSEKDRDRSSTSQSEDAAEPVQIDPSTGGATSTLQTDLLGRNLGDQDSDTASLAFSSEETMRPDGPAVPTDTASQVRAPIEHLAEGSVAPGNPDEHHGWFPIVGRGEGERQRSDIQAAFIAKINPVSASNASPEAPTANASSNPSDSQTKAQISNDEFSQDPSVPPKAAGTVNARQLLPPQSALVEANEPEIHPIKTFSLRSGLDQAKAAEDARPTAGPISTSQAATPAKSQGSGPVSAAALTAFLPALVSGDQGTLSSNQNVNQTDLSTRISPGANSLKVGASVSGSLRTTDRFRNDANAGTFQDIKTISDAGYIGQISESVVLGEGSLFSSGNQAGHLTSTTDSFLDVAGKHPQAYAAYRDAVVSQTIEAIVRSVSTEQSQTTELTLTPDELGKLKFEITTQDDQTSIRVFAERGETLELLRRNADSLLNELRQMGLSQGSLSFGSWSQRSKSEPQTTGGNQSPDQRDAAPDSTHFLSCNTPMQGRLHIRL
ncbi:flagellar hook-length control protein FliK [Thioclava sp. FR2]|uniref:flagellar hook-length control protein FliK n=1 Tax=Thioclava sp. FR2 TaxID=3445780 RepID=UPI003EBCCC4C